MMGQLCMCIMHHFLAGLDMYVLYCPTMSFDVLYYLFVSGRMYGTIPLIRIYMYNSRDALLRGRLMYV